MGQLVFQATLGGQVNLIGPNTASTFNINVPATSGNMVTTGDTATVTTTMLASTTGSGAVVLATSPTLVTPALGTPSALVGTNITGTAAGLSIGGNAATATTATNVSGGTSSVTSETVSGNLTLSGGTANGVAYLNGSKVVTTGSALVFDGSNLGLGVTPSAWSQSKAFQINTIGALRADTGTVGLNNNAYFNSGWKYLTSAFATTYEQANGQHVWNTAPSGTAGNAITFTQAMTLDASGRLLVGTTSGSGATMLSVNQPTASTDAKTIVSVSTGTNSAYTAYVTNTVTTVGTENSSGGNLVAGSSAYATILSNNGAYPIQFGTNNTVRATIDSSGNLGLGVTPSAYGASNRALDVGSWASFAAIGGSAFMGFNSYATSTTAYAYKNSGAIALGYSQNTSGHQWYNAPSGTAGNAISFTQAMTLDASGNLLIAKTVTGAPTVGTLVGNDGLVRTSMAASTSGTTCYELYSTGAAAYRFYLDMGGTVHATSIVITAISDQRLKENVRDIDTGLNAIMALKPRRFDWKEGKGQDKKNAAGFIAQEFEEVFPESVGTSKAGEDGIEYKNINHETLIPTLVKAIQEQQALIEQLTVRLAAAGI